MSETKICKHCSVEKPTTEYQKAGGGKWLQPYCKPCDSERKKKHYLDNKERVLSKNRKYYEDNKEAISAQGKEQRKLDSIGRPPRVYERMSVEEFKKRKSASDKRYRENNYEKIQAGKKSYYKEKGLEMAKAWQAKQKDNIEHVTKKRLRGRIYVALKRGIKSEGTMELLGCTIDFFKEYFQSLFTEGMTWEKYMAGDVVIDHIKPCKLFDLTKPEEQRACFSYKNLQPLWEVDNLRKGIKYQESKAA